MKRPGTGRSLKRPHESPVNLAHGHATRGPGSISQQLSRYRAILAPPFFGRFGCPPMKIEVHPLTKRRWPDLVELFGRRGASMARGCWCMYYRKTGGSGVGSGDANRKALRALVDRGRVPGLIGYRDGRPIGWISLAPREQYAKLRRSPVMKPVDDRPVWSIVCFFVDAG